MRTVVLSNCGCVDSYKEEWKFIEVIPRSLALLPGTVINSKIHIRIYKLH